MQSVDSHEVIQALSLQLSRASLRNFHDALEGFFINEIFTNSAQALSRALSNQLYYY